MELVFEPPVGSKQVDTATEFRMGELLDELHRLQEVELKLAELRQARDDKSRRVDRLKRRREQIDEKIRQHSRLVRERQARIDALSLDVAAREEQINKHRVALTKAKTNKEYASILAAMNTEKADNSKVETEILQHMEELQTLSQEGERLEAEKQELLQSAEAARKVLDEFNDETHGERGGLEATRNEHAEKIPPPIFNTFTRVAQRHEGDAMATVRKVHPKRDEYICEGCNMKVTLEMVNALRSRDEVQLCSHCGRILYFEAAAAR